MRVTRKNDIRVTIYPTQRMTGDWNSTFQTVHPVGAETERRFEAACNDIIAQIHRHIDFSGQVMVEWDRKVVCSFCEDPDNSEDFPWCCEPAQLEWLRANPDFVPVPVYGTVDADYIEELRHKIEQED